MHFLHTDLRRGIDGLAQIIQKQAVGSLNRLLDPCSNSLFLFA